MNEKITIIIPTCGVNFNNALKPCIESVVANTDLKSVEVVVIANGVKDEQQVQSFLEPLPVGNKWFDEPLGYIGAINKGLDYVYSKYDKPDYVMFLNDDTLIHSKDWVELLLTPFRKDPKIGIVGAKSLPCPITGIDFPLGFCEMIKMEVIDKVGRLDPNLGIGYGDDTDIAIKAIKLGYHIYSYINGFDRKLHKSIGEFPISHFAENTMHSKVLFSLEDWNNQAEKNKKILAERYWEKIHIIVPVYKRYSRLEKVLEDLKNQYYWKFKVYVVADGEDKKVEEIVEQTKKEWAKLPNPPELEYSFLNPPDNHYGDGQRIEILNKLEASDKEWIAFLDSDNSVKQEWLLHLWQATFLKNVGGAWCKIHHSETGRDIPEPEFQNEPVYWHIDTLNMMVRLDIAKKFASLWHLNPIGNDFLFANSCFKESPWAFVDEVLGSHGQPLSVLVMSVCRNEEKIIPFYLRHYESIADKILIYDGGSTDKSLDLLNASSKVEIVSVPEEKMNNRNLTDFRNEAWKKYRYDYDFVIVCDMDEFVYHPKLREKLDEFKGKEITIPAVKGFQMLSEFFPHGYKGQIYEAVQKGYHDPQWLNKVAVFDPAKIDVNYRVGCHQADPTGKIKKSDEPLYLLHFKYVGYSEFIERNKILAERLSDTDIQNGWAFHYARDAQMTKEQFMGLEKETVNVIKQEDTKGDKKRPEVTVGIPTKNRYFSTLPTTLLSVMMQTYPVKKLILVDDSDPKADGKMTDLREDPMYQYLFSMLSKKGIEWEVIFGQHKGQHFSHQIVMDKAKTELVWRLDDDEYAEPNVLEELVKQMKDGVGVVGGLVLDPKMSQLAPPNYINTNRMSDINTRENTQWMKQPEGQVFEVEHLYSSFLYRKVDDIKFCLELSPAAHREETLFSYEYVRKGWKALVTTSAVTWHFRNPSGGIRSHNNPEYWAGDDKIFQRKLAAWQVNMEGKKMIVLDSGIGDAICFKEIVPELLKKYPKLVIGTYYSLLFKDLPVETMHPWQAKDIVGDKITEAQNVYRKLWAESDKGRKMHLIEAYRELFLQEKV